MSLDICNTIIHSYYNQEALQMTNEFLAQVQPMVVLLEPQTHDMTISHIPYT